MRNFILLLVSLVSSSAIAQSTVYQVSKGASKIYLGGTVHILRETDYPLPKEYETAYQEADVLALETNTANLTNPEIIQRMLAEGTYQDARTLKTVLADTIYAALAKAFEKVGMPLEMLQKMKPSLAVTTLSAYQMQTMGMTTEGVDVHFSNRAQQDKKEIHELESADDQIKQLTTMADGRENEFVSYSLKGMNNMKEELEALIDDWKSGSATKMEQEIADMKKEYPKAYGSLLVDRNNNWMPKILSYLENDTKAFVLVGSLHLYGPDGLINLLRQQGYTVEKL